MEMPCRSLRGRLDFGPFSITLITLIGHENLLRLQNNKEQMLPTLRSQLNAHTKRHMEQLELLNQQRPATRSIRWRQSNLQYEHLATHPNR